MIVEALGIICFVIGIIVAIMGIIVGCMELDYRWHRWRDMRYARKHYGHINETTKP